MASRVTFCTTELTGHQTSLLFDGFNIRTLIGGATPDSVGNVWWEPNVHAPLLVMDWGDDRLTQFCEAITARRVTGSIGKWPHVVLLHDGIAWRGVIRAPRKDVGIDLPWKPTDQLSELLGRRLEASRRERRALPKWITDTAPWYIKITRGVPLPA